MPSDLGVWQKQRIRRRRFGTAMNPLTTPGLVWAWDPDVGVGNANVLAGPATVSVSPTRTAGSPSFYTFAAGDVISWGDALDTSWTSAAGFTVHTTVKLQAADIAASNLRTVNKDDGGTTREWALNVALGKPTFAAFYGAGSTNFETSTANVALTAGRYVLTIVFDPTAAFGSRLTGYVNGVAIAQTRATTGVSGTISDTASILAQGSTFSISSVSIQSYIYGFNVPQSAATVASIASYIRTVKGWV